MLSWVAIILCKGRHMIQPSGSVSYSQFGEDMLVSQLLPQSKGFYVDCGAHDPWRYSNTALLHQRGWTGINIDADEAAVERLRNGRPSDINVHCGVSDRPGTLSFAHFADGAVNTFDPAMTQQQSAGLGAPVISEVPVDTLAVLLERYVPQNTAIDYLNVDCEGYDFKVLSGNDWSRFVPKVISIEIHGLDLLNALSNPVVAFLVDRGYLFRGQYFPTSIFHHISAL
jgi:FkbM family methyltransferase